MNIYDQAIQLTSHMTPSEKTRLLEYLSRTLKHDIETEAYKQMPWEQFIDRTYGSLADDPNKMRFLRASSAYRLINPLQVVA